MCETLLREWSCQSQPVAVFYSLTYPIGQDPQTISCAGGKGKKILINVYE